MTSDAPAGCALCGDCEDPRCRYSRLHTAHAGGAPGGGSDSDTGTAARSPAGDREASPDPVEGLNGVEWQPDRKDGVLRRLWRKRLFRPEAAFLLARDLLGLRHPELETDVHLREAAAWILRAHDAGGGGGIALGYSFEDGWIPAYPETTGYIIPTLIAYARYAGEDEYRRRAIVMAEWELGLQFDCGAFPGSYVAEGPLAPVVFNTGQILFGLMAAHGATGEGRFLDAARRSGAWLVRLQSADGAWRRFDYLGCVHSYNARTAWALVELGLRTGETTYVDAGVRHLDWVTAQQEPNGWIRQAAFEPDQDPFVHTVAYTIQGLLEAGMRLERSDFVAAAIAPSRVLLDRLDARGSLAATFDAAWRPTARSACLTGIAQMAVIWLRLFQHTGEVGFADGARRALGFLKRLQDCGTGNAHIRGALKGSHPLFGRYLFGTYPNWAVKFFMDALLLDEEIRSGQPRELTCW